MGESSQILASTYLENTNNFDILIKPYLKKSFQISEKQINPLNNPVKVFESPTHITRVYSNIIEDAFFKAKKPINSSKTNQDPKLYQLKKELIATILMGEEKVAPKVLGIQFSTENNEMYLHIEKLVCHKNGCDLEQLCKKRCLDNDKLNTIKVKIEKMNSYGINHGDLHHKNIVYDTKQKDFFIIDFEYVEFFEPTKLTSPRSSANSFFSNLKTELNVPIVGGIPLFRYNSLNEYKKQRPPYYRLEGAISVPSGYRPNNFEFKIIENKYKKKNLKTIEQNLKTVQPELLKKIFTEIKELNSVVINSKNQQSQLTIFLKKITNMFQDTMALANKPLERTTVGFTGLPYASYI